MYDICTSLLRLEPQFLDFRVNAYVKKPRPWLSNGCGGMKGKILLRREVSAAGAGKKMLLTSSGGGPSMPTAVCGIAPRSGSLSKRRVCMRRLFISCAGLAVALGGFAGNARAQFKNGGQAIELRLPTLSQRAIGTQRIGLTDITVNYCRPLVGGREIWGK